MELYQLNTFVKLADEGSLTRAGEPLVEALLSVVREMWPGEQTRTNRLGA